MDIALTVSLVFVLFLMLIPGSVASRARARFALLGTACLVAFTVLEIYIRVFDPFPILLRAGRIDLPANSSREFRVGAELGLEPLIRVTYNSLGFRGAEPPTPWPSYLTIVCVGGSTTQCLYLSEGTTWADRLNDQLPKYFDRVWLNNAGIDGHSTFGHLELFGQYIAPLHPKVLLVYAGLNDVDRNDLNAYETSTFRSRSRLGEMFTRKATRLALRNSDVFALIDNFRLRLLAKRKGLAHSESVGHQKLGLQPTSLTLSGEARRAWLDHRDPNCLENYRRRLKGLVQNCIDENILCVLVTQPVLYGEGIDDVTGVDLETVRVGETDGWTHWQLLKDYNRVTLEVGSEMGVPVIDAAKQMPKSSKYFYDLTHCNTEGASRLASILEMPFVEILKSQFPSHIKNE